MFVILNNVAGNIAPNWQLDRYNSLNSIGSAVVNVLLGVVFSVSLITLAFSGILYVMAQGDPKRLETAWRAFIWSVVSMMVALLVVGIKAAVLAAMGTTDTNLINGPSF
jgi:hypothetical protein